MSPTRIWASAASGALGKKVMKSLYSCSAWVQSCRAAFAVPAVGDGQLGAHLVRRIRVGVQQRLQVETGNVKVPFFVAASALS